MRVAGRSNPSFTEACGQGWLSETPPGWGHGEGLGVSLQLAPLLLRVTECNAGLPDSCSLTPPLPL